MKAAPTTVSFSLQNYDVHPSCYYLLTGPKTCVKIKITKQLAFHKSLAREEARPMSITNFEAQVYVLYTGGTIGSTGSPLAPASGPDFAQLVLSEPGLADFRVAGYEGLRYSIDSLDTPLDSSNMTPT